MGGSGSGHWYRWSKKSTDENFYRFSIFRLKKLGVIARSRWASGTWQWSRNGEVVSSIGYELNTMDSTNPCLRVHYTNKSADKSYDYKIYLSTTTPRYGGVRWWFKCPGLNCGKRVGVLYLGNVLVCRHCWNMAYASQSEGIESRLSSKAQKIHQQLGGSGCLMDDTPPKPKGMHWKTYNHKVEAMINAEDASWIMAGMKWGIVP